MNATAQKLDLIHWITELKEPDILNMLETIKEQSLKNDWWDTVSGKERTAIKKGLEDVKAGQVVSHSEVKKRYEKWL
jgi:hypothetical protein